MSMTCLMVLLVVLGTCFLRKYVFDAYEGVRCRNYHRWVSLRWRIPRRNHLMGDWLFHFVASYQRVKSNFYLTGHSGGVHGRSNIRPGIPLLSDFCPILFWFPIGRCGFSGVYSSGC